MEPLTQDDPRRLGPYHVIARLAPGTGEVTTAARYFVGRSAGGKRTAVVTTPLTELVEDTAYRGRFLREAENASLLGRAQPCPWLVPVLEISDDADGPPWSAAPYRPMVSLPAALEAHGGPLPAHTVRALGAALAETLAAIHQAGFTHAGVAPGSVFVADNGPRLAGFGAVRAAGSDGEARADMPGLAVDALPPEQISGGRPRPLGDIFALGAVLAYAATGEPHPEESALPEELRATLGSCLAPDPADRPTARALSHELMRGVPLPLSAESVAQAQAPPGPTPTVVDGGPVSSSGGPVATVLNGGPDRPAALPDPGWLPVGVLVALAEQSSVMLTTEVEPAHADSPEDDAVRAPSPAPIGPLASPGHITADGRGTAGVPRPPTRLSGRTDPAETAVPQAAARSSRRALLIGAAWGTAGAAVGGATMWAGTAEDDSPLTPAERLAAAHRSRRRLEGAPPRPLWRYDVEGKPSAQAPLVCAGRTVVLVTDKDVTGLDLRTGKRLWALDVRAWGRLQPVGENLVLVPGAELVAVDPRTGETEGLPKEFRSGGGTSQAAVLAAERGTVWIAVERRKEGAVRRDVIAYDLNRRAELWRSRLPGRFDEGYLTKDALVVRGERFLAFDRTGGTRRWTRSYEGVTAGEPVAIEADNALVAAISTTLRGYDMARGAGPVWTVKAMGEAESGGPAAFGPPVVHGDTVYATDGGYAVHALSKATGDVRWQRTYAFAMAEVPGTRTPDTAVNPSGDTVLMANDVELDAFDADDGTLRWRFTDGGAAVGKGTVVSRRRMALTDDLAVVVSGRSVYALPLR
ncbi:PQQ-binding-like beta-propeller repeat protein [Streptomyces sp. NPDC021098]|uniref:outer membrane protein assembly factor BamB family protein n=1 Tax=unclassified Streptomyces TaxID=2593676 RepID=UPI00378B59C1